MIVYILLILVLIIRDYINKQNKNLKAKKAYCIVSAIMLFVVIALRDEKLGNSDTVTLYIPKFEFIQTLNLVAFFQTIKDTDIVFYLLMKLYTVFSNNIHIYFAILAIPYVWIFSKFIYKYSKNVLISYLTFLAFNYYFLSFITLRHSLASAFLLLALMKLLENKNRSFLTYVLIACLFHKTAIAFLLAYPLTKIKFNYKRFIIIIITSLIAFILGDIFLKILFTIIKDKHYQLYANVDKTMNLNIFIINVCWLFLFCIANIRKSMNKGHFWLNLFLVGTAISELVVIRDVFYRLALYFSVVEIILIPNSIENIKNIQMKIAARYFFSFVLIAYTFVSTLSNLNLLNYRFFWR